MRCRVFSQAHIPGIPSPHTRRCDGMAREHRHREHRRRQDLDMDIGGVLADSGFLWLLLQVAMFSPRSCTYLSIVAVLPDNFIAIHLFCESPSHSPGSIRQQINVLDLVRHLDNDADGGNSRRCRRTIFRMSRPDFLLEAEDLLKVLPWQSRHQIFPSSSKS